jgi:acyl-coenzyme A synthetase/AMP-(fatty) acid ligase
MTDRLPFFSGYSSFDEPALYTIDGPISIGQVLAASVTLAKRLPDAAFYVNTLADRHQFLVGFFASLIRGGTTLMPADLTTHTLGSISASYQNICYLTAGEALKPNGAPSITIDVEIPSITAADRSGFGDSMTIAAAHHAASPFTSGSTGVAIPHPKPWSAVVAGAQSTARRFFPNRTPVSIVATVPQQHMYGFETSIMLPLFSGSGVWSVRPLFPNDIARALAAVPAPRVLVTTPIHLKALVASPVTLPPITTVISATAPLSAELARQFEERYHAPVHEIFGCTEAGSIATRRTIEGDTWTTFDGVTLTAVGEEFIAAGGHVPAPVKVCDQFDLMDNTHFIHLGREWDIVNIAGKRTSLSYLSATLATIDGVEDGVFFLPHSNDRDGAIARVAAFVVAPGMTTDRLLQALKEKIDPIFLPRPLRFVNSLGRNSTGKLTKAGLLTLQEQYANEP